MNTTPAANEESPPFPPTIESSSPSAGSTSMDSSPPRSDSSHQVPSIEESECYYAGLPSRSRLIGRSDATPWVSPSSRWTYQKCKSLRSVGKHAVKEIWENGLCRKIGAYLDSKSVAATNVDVVRIGDEGGPIRTVVVWIDVRPGSLSVEDGTEVAHACHGLLLQSGLNDVEVEIREPRAKDVQEFEWYYLGLPSRPRLVGRSSNDPWVPSDYIVSQRPPKVLGPVGKHAIKEVWENDLCPKIIAHLGAKNVAWTSIDVVRIGFERESLHPVVVWIGVQPASLSTEDGAEMACICHGTLLRSGINDVEVEIRESRVTSLKSPKLIAPSSSSKATADIRDPLSYALGLPISAKATPWAQGTGGLFIAEGGSSKRLFLVTARHVVFKPNQDDNKTYVYSSPSAPRHEVNLLGDPAFKDFLQLIEKEIDSMAWTREHLKKCVAAIDKKVGDMLEDQRKQAEGERRRIEKDLAELEDVDSIEALKTFYQDVSTHWATPDERTLGHVVYSPPFELCCGEEKYTQDLALIEFDLSKIDAAKFEGNVIDLGTKFRPFDLELMMHANFQNSHGFVYAKDRLLRLKGTIPDAELRNPQDVDQHGEPCLMVLKRGTTSKLTVGRALDIRSCVRDIFADGKRAESFEWAIAAFDNKSGAFSEHGDSGAVVADGRGRIGGIMTAGAGLTEFMDITYATTIHNVMQSIKKKFLRAHLNADAVMQTPGQP